MGEVRHIREVNVQCNDRYRGSENEDEKCHEATVTQFAQNARKITDGCAVGSLAG